MSLKYFAVVGAAWLLLNVSYIYGDFTPAIVWDPKNPLFDCPANDGPEIVLKLGDIMTLLCPNRGTNPVLAGSATQDNMMYESAFLIADSTESLKNYQTCNAKGARQILRCDTPSKLKFIKIPIRQFSASSSSLVFQPGKTYYVIGTSNQQQSDIDNTQGGSCMASPGSGINKLKMKIRICTDQEIKDGKCNQCKTAACYSNGCGRFEAWQQTNLVKDLTELNSTWNSSVIHRRQLSSDCLSVSERKCSYGNCAGPVSKLEKINCPKIQPLIDCYQWNLHGDLLKNGSECLSTKSRKCIVGVFGKTVFHQTDLYSVPCPAPPTAPVPTMECGEWKLSKTYKVGTGKCFDIYHRDCNVTNLKVPTQFQQMKPVSYACPTSTQKPTTQPETTTPKAKPRTTPTTQPTTLPTTTRGRDGFTPWGPWGPCINYMQSRRRSCYNPTILNGVRYCLGIVEMFRSCGISIGAATGARTSGMDGSKVYIIGAATFIVGLLIGACLMLMYRRCRQKSPPAPREESSFEFTNDGFNLDSPTKKEFPDPPQLITTNLASDASDRLSIDHNFGRGMGERAPSNDSLVELKGFTPLPDPAPELLGE